MNLILHRVVCFLKISVSTAMSGPGILYGKTQPYLKKVDLHEHYYIQGPADQRDNAIQIFASMGE